MNKIQPLTKRLQKDAILSLPNRVLGHLVIGLLEVVGRLSRGWLCETLAPSQSSVTILQSSAPACVLHKTIVYHNIKS